MSKIDKIKTLSLLFDTYSELLTDNQREVFTMYYLEDNSLAEIADALSISRPAASDNLKKTEEKLKKYESKLQLVKRNEKITKLLDKSSDKKTADKIKEII